MGMWEDHDEVFKNKEKDLEKTILQVAEVLGIPYPEPEGTKKGILKSKNGESFSVNLLKSQVNTDFIFKVEYLQIKEKNEKTWYQPYGTLYIKGLKNPVNCYLHSLYSNKFQTVGNLVYGRVTDGKMQLILKEKGNGFTSQE